MKNIFENEKLMVFLDEFNELYSKRPIYDNSGGMKSAHLFPLYCYLKIMNPEFILESGVYKGQGTWLMRECCPDSEIVSIDINFSNLVFKDKKTTYIQKDISDIGLYDFVKKYESDKVLVFFDDHQDFNKRLDYLINCGIENVIFEDNYPFNQGDCISPKKLVEPFDFYVNQNLVKLEQKDYLVSKIEHYEEFPPIFKDEMTRWGINWSYITREPLLSQDFSSHYDIFYNERFDYTWICYLKLKKQKLIK
jgi:hypothetical protein